MLTQYITRNINITGTDINKKRDEILKYFTQTYELFEKLFDTFVDDSVFYEQPEPLRHQLIFYYGHTATFFINKLILGKFLDTRINPKYESTFAIGVDEMSWDDLNKENYEWPSVSHAKEYRKMTKEVIISYIKTCEFTLPITWESAMWPIIMGIEHEKIHIETSSVLHRQLDIKYIKPNSFGEECKESGKNPKNELVQIPEMSIKLGKSKDSEYYGWDNEYGTYEEDVPSFKTSKYLVSNGEFLEFVNDAGYTTEEYWSTEGNAWRDYKNSSYPIFWVKDNHIFKYRTLTNIIDMPLDWPVDVNYLEAQAFCNWKSKKTNSNITLPSETMWHSMANHSKIIDDPQWGEKPPANINLEYYSSSCPVNKFKTGELYDVTGNVWQWTTTTIDGFEGFEVHPLYDDFSVPTFDNRHNIFKGGSWISTGNETLKDSRYAFRRHFPQHAGFRYIQLEKENISLNNKSKKIVEDQHHSQYLKAAAFALKYALKKEKALNIGSYFGTAAFALAKEFNYVIGIDFTARNVLNAEHQKRSKGIKNIEFWQGDSCNLKEHLNNFDLILATNDFDELYNFESFSHIITTRLNKNGIFVLQGIPLKKSEKIEKFLNSRLTKIDDLVWKKV